jgi:hypothetical protein
MRNKILKTLGITIFLILFISVAAAVYVGSYGMPL